MGGKGEKKRREKEHRQKKRMSKGLGKKKRCKTESCSRWRGRKADPGRSGEKRKEVQRHNGEKTKEEKGDTRA